ncbi:hypothetical protein tb265_32930 [Gemmatimonadetes bacterium T265]|nr:hypothetical protein tb265_32930 [Gemmatimonadetes bacterium T265]
MGRFETLARAWRRSPHAFVPPALALGGVFAAAVCADHAPGLGRAPYALPWVALLGWLLLGLQPLARYARRPRARPAGEEPVAAALLFRLPLGAAVLGCAGMAAYYLVVGAALDGAWWTTASSAEVAARVYALALQGVTGGLMVWEIALGGAARRARAGERRRT